MSYELMETFEKQSSELYSLAFLLTGNADSGVESFPAALWISTKTTRISESS